MKVDIWSDVRCPFCYIGKHKFEKALNDFPGKENIEVVWHSFELDPELKTDTSVTNYEHLAMVKGISETQAKEMSRYVIDYAEGLDLNFNFEKVVVANSFRAHKLIQHAKNKGKANEVEEALFRAYFSEGKNIDDENVITDIAVSAGLDEKEVKTMLASDDLNYAVVRDEQDARNLGINSVPFFVFNDKYAVSGAQQPEVFSQALSRSWKEFAASSKPQILNEGNSCTTDGNCS